MSEEKIVQDKTIDIKNIPSACVNETIDTGVVYRITNIDNGKKYYGQAISYRIHKGKYIRHGSEKRFEEHCNDALKGKDYCPKLYSAIRKYGKEKFKSELVLICERSKLNENESYYIVNEKTHISGYNVITHNVTTKIHDNKSRIEKIQATMFKKWKDPIYIEKTTAANLKAVEKRAESGKTRKSNKDLPNNIYECANGYDIRIMRDGEYKITSVTSTTKNKNVLLEEAIKMRDKIFNDFEKGIISKHQKKVDHNGNPLPKCISCKKARGSDGYSVIITINGKRKDKYFTDGSKTMDEKLELAKKFLENYKLTQTK